MAIEERSSDKYKIRDIDADLENYSEVETTFNRVLAGFLAWIGGNDFGGRLAKGVWGRAYKTPPPEFENIEVHREYRLVNDAGKTVWPDIVIADNDILWMFETKTDLRSVRPGQLEEQITCARKILNSRQLFVAAVTPTRGAFATPAGISPENFSEVTWAEISEAVQEAAIPLPAGPEKENFEKFITAAREPHTRKAAGSGGGNSLPTWQPDRAGIMYLPEPYSKSGQIDRPYFVVEVSRSGECTKLKGPFTWATAREEAIEIGKNRNKVTYATPEGEKFAALRAEGLLTW